MNALAKVPLWFFLLFFASGFLGATLIFSFLFGKWGTVGVFIALTVSILGTMLLLIWAGSEYQKENEKNE